MKSPFIPDRIFPVSQRLVLTALWLGANLQMLDAQTTGHTNVPTTKDIYELQPIQASLAGNRPLPIKLETYLSKTKTEKGEPEDPPKDEDIHWSASRGAPKFSPQEGSSVELEFGQPFVKDDNSEARKVKVTATYSGSASVQPSSRDKDVERVYLDFWIAGTEERADDVLIVRAQDAQPTADEKKVIHWAKVVVKHSAPSKLPLQLESSGDKPLYFYGEEQDPNQRSEDPSLESSLNKELEAGKWFWIGTDVKGTGQVKFKAKGDAGKGFKDAPEEKTVNLLPVELVDTKNKILDDGDDVTIEPKKSSDDKNLKSIAWIEPHGSEAALDAPDMPQLALCFRGAETIGLKIKWKLNVEYKRSNGRVVAEDKVLIPSAVGGGQQPWHEEALDGAVEIFNHATWLSELQQKGFFGGYAELTYQLLKSDGPTLGSEQKMLFYIGGKNPDDAKCRVFITQTATQRQQPMAWFAYAIAKHESKDYNGAGSRYNQFWDKAGRFGGTDHQAGEVLWVNNPGEAPPKGFGMFQITGNVSNNKSDIPRKQLWDWHEGVRGGLDIVASKRGIADRYFARIQRKSAQHKTAYQGCLPPNISIGSHTFSSADAIQIYGYNGTGSVTIDSRYPFDPNKPCGLSSTSRWFWSPHNVAGGEPYIRKIERELNN